MMRTLPDTTTEKQGISSRDFAVVGAFMGAISVLLLVGCYVIYRFSGHKAHQEKWKDYDDCGWA